MASVTVFIEVLKREIFSAKQKAPLKTVVIVLAIFALEKILTTTKIYKCPEESHRLYGGMFLFAPSLCLSGLSVLMSNTFWDSASSHRRTKYKQKTTVVCHNICYVLARALLVGVGWLVLAFGTSDFYVCFRVGANQPPARSNKIQAQSVMLAWSMLASIIVLGLIYIAVKRCCLPHHKDGTLHNYERLETEAAVSKFEKEIQALAKKQGEKQVTDILDEIENGKDALEVVRKAENLLLHKSQRTHSLENGTRLCENRNETDSEVELVSAV